MLKRCLIDHRSYHWAGGSHANGKYPPTDEACLRSGCLSWVRSGLISLDDAESETQSRPTLDRNGLGLHACALIVEVFAILDDACDRLWNHFFPANVAVSDLLENVARKHSQTIGAVAIEVVDTASVQ